MACVQRPVESLPTDGDRSYILEPFGVAVNKKGEVLVTNSQNNHVCIFDTSTGRLKKSDIRHEKMKRPAGIAVDCEDNILVTDIENNELLKFSPAGEFITAVGNEVDGPLKDLLPCDVCVSKFNKRVYVTNNTKHCVYVLNSDLTYYNKFGSKGKEEGQFDKPNGVACDSSGKVYIVEESFINYRIQIFNADGEYLQQFKEERRGIKHPCCICIDHKNRVYVGEESSGQRRVSMFSKTGKFQKSIPEETDLRHQLKGLPLRIAVDQNGKVYVSDALSYKVWVF